MSTTTKKKKRREQAGADDYLELVHRFPLRPIRTKADYDRAGQVLEQLVARADAGLTLGESDYTDVLSRLVGEYDELHSSILKEIAAGRKSSPIEILRYLMEEHSMNTIELGKLVGGSGQASMILNGKRELSKANIRTLAERFKVSPALFI
ncbi:MAG: hypothetical protein WBD40_10045 [Tepidisphaeraceae bacterium]